MSKEIKHTIFYAHPPQDVWDYLTKPELIEQWLMKNDFQPVVGYHFQFRANPMPQFDFNGIINCTVLEVMPFKRLSYTWQGGGNDGRPTLDSIVEWTLTAKDNGTELQVIHSGFKEVDITMFNIMSEGWRKNIQKITNLLNTAQ